MRKFQRCMGCSAITGGVLFRDLMVDLISFITMMRQKHLNSCLQLVIYQRPVFALSQQKSPIIAMHSYLFLWSSLMCNKYFEVTNNFNSTLKIRKTSKDLRSYQEFSSTSIPLWWQGKYSRIYDVTRTSHLRICLESEPETGPNQIWIEKYGNVL